VSLDRGRAIIPSRENFLGHSLDSLLSDHPWLVGTSKSIADIAVAARLDEIVRTSTGLSGVIDFLRIGEWLEPVRVPRRFRDLAAVRGPWFRILRLGTASEGRGLPSLLVLERVARGISTVSVQAEEERSDGSDRSRDFQLDFRNVSYRTLRNVWMGGA